MPTTVEVLLFDLGGVLVEFSGVQDVAPLLRVEATESEIVELWRRCPHTDAFHRGELSREAFAERFMRDWGIDMPPERFLPVFRSWSKRLLPGAEDLLAALRPRFRLAALSNSNELHWERNANELRIIELFEFAISSHEVGLCKPDPAIYRVALERAKVSSPDAIVFFDDLAANVDAAKSVGMRAHQVRGVDELRARLVSEGLMSATDGS
jgi:epoxide hydrolase-like predicted phosphatase